MAVLYYTMLIVFVLLYYMIIYDFHIYMYHITFIILNLETKSKDYVTLLMRPNFTGFIKFIILSFCFRDWHFVHMVYTHM